VQKAARLDEAAVFQSHSHLLSHLGGVYVVTDTTLWPGRTVSDIAHEGAAGGARVLQVREKGASTAALTEHVNLLASGGFGGPAGLSLLIVNDRVDVALASGADGVHLGPDDMRPEDARRLLGPDKLIGVSTGTLEEARAAAPYASYFGVGAIFGSRTKLDAGEPVGVGRIREIKAAFPHTPVVAIGGITADNIAEVARAGADAAAVVSAVVGAPDMEAATRALVRRFEAARAEAAR
jgi:thiamine-phosphate diphosphorylase